MDHSVKKYSGVVKHFLLSKDNSRTAKSVQCHSSDCKIDVQRKLTNIPLSQRHIAHEKRQIGSTRNLYHVSKDHVGISNVNIANVYYGRRKHGKYVTKRPAVTIMITAFVFLLSLNQQYSTEAAITKLPTYLDVEAALEISKCTVREEVVDIRTIHSTLPSNAIYIPSCVVLHRCSGCCQSDRLRCIPSSTYESTIQISQQMLNPSDFSYITLQFTHHESCACKSIDEPAPLCLPKKCESREVWNAESCSCTADKATTMACSPKICAENESWNDEICDCMPTIAVCARIECSSDEIWNETACACVRSQAISCTPKNCHPSQIFNEALCKCEPKCPVQKCERTQLWNPHSCRCQCRPCHPSRIYHARFNQDLRTCQCTCRAKHHNMLHCARRNAVFNNKTCTCEKIYHRGRRG